jgi:Kef-type K+ transport system membrane component KefB
VETEQLILSIGAILLAARVLGWIFQRVGQPRVVGEMAAGIVLGPSLLGHLFPRAFATLFPPSSIPALSVLSQLGLLLFMFVVGLEVDLKRILKQRAAVVLISNVSIVLPLALGVVLATSLYPRFAGERVSFSSFALFMGTAMSITAFPVLARILKERNLLGTGLGTMAISCAAIPCVPLSKTRRGHGVHLFPNSGHARGQLDDRTVGSACAVWRVHGRPGDAKE